MDRKIGWLTCAAWIVASIAILGADPPTPDAVAQARRLLDARGLQRVGSTYVLPVESRVRSAIAGLETLVAQNRAALRRTQVRSSITNQSHSMFLGLQGQRLALNATIANNPIPGPNAPGMPRGLTAAEERSAQFGQILDDTDVQLRNITNIVAGVAADIETDAAESLARQDEFAQSAAGLDQPAAAIGQDYKALATDPEVSAALATLGQAEGHAVTLGPIEDYSAHLALLRSTMDATRVLTVLPGRTAPDYTVAALLADSSRRNLRFAMGRLEAWDKNAATRPTPPDPAERAALESQVAALRKRFVRSVVLVRQAYDDLQARPLANTTAPPAGPPPAGGSSAADLSRFRALVEQQRAGLRAAFVSEVERAIRVARLPLERRADGLWIKVHLAGGGESAMRLDPQADLVRLPEGLARTLGVLTEPAPAWELVNLPDGTAARARRGTLRSLTIGPFPVADVACLVVAGDETKPTLGSGVLGSFVTRVDTSTEPPELALTRVDLKPIPPRPLPAGAPPPKTRTRNGAPANRP